MQTSIKSISVFIFFSLLLFWESYRPRFKGKAFFEKRKFSNIFLALSNYVLGYFLGFYLLFFALSFKMGLFHLWQAPPLIQLIATLLLLDMAIYFQHIISHKWSFIWKFHKVHHSDLFLDATSALRFHFGEIFISYLYKAFIGFALGAKFEHFIIFETILTLCALFNHSNIKLPQRANRYLKLFIVTPQMHRIHHSPLGNETNQNYGFALACWDRLFKTYREKTAQKDLEHMAFGEPRSSLESDLSLWKILIYPFRAKA